MIRRPKLGRNGRIVFNDDHAHRLSELHVAAQIARAYAQEARALYSAGALSWREMAARISDARLAFLAAKGAAAQIMLERPSLRKDDPLTVVFDGNPYAI